MLRLRDGETIRTASPETAFDQELVKLKQRGKRYARGAQVHRRASHGIDHPGRSGNDMPGRDYEMNDPAVGALFAVLAAKPMSEIRVPTVMDLDLLPNMGRMTPRWRCRAGLARLHCWIGKSAHRRGTG
ncbi:hypothetical protein X756_31280 [Mesorhizobium sp. LSHC412B00]|nr:hypothetical protein X756_31280 [Mesorhizobium sp. LSHC412B00]